MLSTFSPTLHPSKCIKSPVTFTLFSHLIHLHEYISVTKEMNMTVSATHIRFLRQSLKALTYRVSVRAGLCCNPTVMWRLYSLKVRFQRCLKVKTEKRWCVQHPFLFWKLRICMNAYFSTCSHHKDPRRQLSVWIVTKSISSSFLCLIEFIVPLLVNQIK